MKYSEIPQFTRTAPYAVDQSWDYLEGAMDRYFEYGLQTDPDFQRAHVWSEDKQIAFVEYQLRGGKSGQDLYFNHPGWMRSFKGEFVLVDGKQRLEAVRKFLRNELPIFGGNFRKDFEGHMGSSPSFRFHINDLRTRREVLQWYLDLNTGGVVHTEDELNKVREMLAQEQ